MSSAEPQDGPSDTRARDDRLQSGERSNGSGASRGAPGLRWGGDGSLRPPDSGLVERAEADVEAQGAPLGLSDQLPADAKFASFLRRAGGWLVDGLLKFALLTIVVALTGMPSVDDPAVSPVLALSLNLVVRFYDAWFFSRGWTPGALVFGMRIIGADGNPPGVMRGIWRALGVAFSELLLGIGYLWMLWDPKRQTWHDKLAGTYVIVAPEESGRSTSR